MNVDIAIRHAAESDYDAVSLMLQHSDSWHAEALPSIFRVPAEPRLSRGEFAETLASAEALVVVAESGSSVIGFLEASVGKPTRADEADSRWGEVHNLYMDVRWRRHGVGRMLLREAETWATQLGLASMRLTVFAFNQGARAFYEALGFEPLAIELHRSLQ